MVSVAPIPCSTHARTRTQDGEAAEPLMRGDITDLVQEVVNTLVTQGNSQVLVTNATPDGEKSSTSGPSLERRGKLQLLQETKNQN